MVSCFSREGGVVPKSDKVAGRDPFVEWEHSLERRVCQVAQVVFLLRVREKYSFSERTKANKTVRGVSKPGPNRDKRWSKISIKPQ